MSLQVRNTYRDFYNNKYSPFSDSIKEIVDLFEMYDYNKCAKKTIEILKSLIPDISRVATECKNQFPQFEYYFDKIECCKKIFDQIICPLELWDKTFVNYNDIVHLSPIRPANKKDCVQLLLLFDNAHEFAAVVNACLYVKRTIDRRI